MSLKRKDLLGMADLSVEEIQLILQTADSFKEVSGRDIKKVPTLRGKTVVNLFFEPSTRTRTSFELAAKRLSADVINFAASTSSVVKGETLLDTASNIEAMQADFIVLRHPSAGGRLSIRTHDHEGRDRDHREGDDGNFVPMPIGPNVRVLTGCSLGLFSSGIAARRA